MIYFGKCFFIKQHNDSIKRARHTPPKGKRKSNGDCARCMLMKLKAYQRKKLRKKILGWSRRACAECGKIQDDNEVVFDRELFPPNKGCVSDDHGKEGQMMIIKEFCQDLVPVQREASKSIVLGANAKKCR